MNIRFSLMAKTVTVASLVVIAAMSAFSIYIDRLQQDVIGRGVSEEIHSVGGQGVQSVANWLEARIMLTDMVAKATAKVGDAAGTRSVLQNDVLTGAFISTYVGQQSGTFIQWPEEPLPADYDPRQRPWYKDAVTAGGPVLTDPYVDASSKDLIVSAAVPIKRDGQLVGVVGSDFSLKTLADIIGSVDFGGNGSAFLVNQQGKILIAADRSLLNKSLADAFPKNTPSLTGEVSESVFGEQSVLVSFAPVLGLPVKGWYLGFIVDHDRAYKGLHAFRVAAMFGTVAGVLLTVVVLGALMRQLVGRPIRTMTAAMGKLAAGDVSITVPCQDYHDEIGSMAQAVQIFKDAAIEQRQLEAAAVASREAEALSRERQAAIDSAKAEDLRVLVGQVEKSFDGLSQGDLTVRMDVAVAPEFEQIRFKFNESVSSLDGVVASVVAAASTIHAGLSEITAASGNLAQRTERQAASLEETVAALTVATQGISGTSDAAIRAQATAAVALRNAEKGGTIVGQTVEAMSEIERSSSKIGNIIGVIDEIAFQTNLLALNAGVEAARAGEAGRGFAVVAQEVRGLAQRSAEAAKEIKSLISASSTQVAHGVQLVSASGQSLREIVEQVGEMERAVSAIAQTAKDQAISLKEVSLAADQMDQVTQQNAAMVEQMTASTRSLSLETDELAGLTSRFRTQDNVLSHPVSKVGPVSQMRSVGQGGAARKPASAPDSWAEF